MSRKSKVPAPESGAAPVESAPVADTNTAAQAKPAKKRAGRPKGPSKLAKKPSKIPMRYDANLKSTIIDIVETARQVGRTWAQTHAAVKKAGYRGSLPALMVFVGKKGKKTRKPGRPKGSKNTPKAAPTTGRGPGRPPKSTAQLNGGLSEVEAIVRREVEARLSAARDAGVAAFEKALGL